MKAKVVYKYPLGMGPNTVALPKNAKIVHIGMQEGFPMMWVEHPHEWESYEKRFFEIFGTGNPIPEDAEHISTFFDPPFVWHVYETAGK